MRWIVLTCLLVGCLGGGDADDTGGVDACALAAAHEVCPACTDGPTTCTFEGTSATEESCGGCQAKHALYAELCAAGDPASEEDLVAGTSCEPDPAR